MEGASELSGWRRRAASGVQALPEPARLRIWRARRAASRASRRRLERRGDWSRSQPAQHGIDRRLDELFEARPGYFVEAGGFDGYTQSNTYFLEHARGWRGLLIEPTAELAREAARERPRSTIVQCGLVAPDFPEKELELRYAGSKTIVEGAGADDWVADAQENQALDQPEHTFTVPARTLSDVLDEVSAPEIDLLSLDVEGYEPEVLSGLDFERHSPRYLVVEVDMCTPRSAVEEVLGTRYRAAEELSRYDVLYERADV